MTPIADGAGDWPDMAITHRVPPTVRDEIARAVARAMDRAVESVWLGDLDAAPLGEWHPFVADATDRILALVRDALLSDAATDRAVGASMARVEVLPGVTAARAPGERMRHILTEVLDAAGLEGEQP